MPHRLKLLAVGACLTVPSLLATANVAAVASTSKSHLASELRHTMRGSSATHLDYSVNDSGIGKLGRAANRSSAPASNEKLFTAITLLQLVGSQFQYLTKVFGTSSVDDGVLRGDLVVRGSGDPTLSRANLMSMARNLHAKGLRHVTGHLIVDDSRYSHKTIVSGWKHSFVPEETGPVDAFTVDQNEWRSGKTFHQDPTAANAALFRHDLKHAHISVGRRTLVRRAPHQMVKLLQHSSPTLAAIIDGTLTDSINFDAEMMFREAGAQRSGHGSPQTGTAAVQAVAKQLHVPLGVIHDGSGLSYTNRETPSTLLQWLQALRSQPYFLTVYYALPLSCATGTLEHRMCGPNVRSKVRAKTGTLDHISALSGFVRAESGNNVTFSFLATGVKNYTTLYSKVDAAVALLRRNG
jgi:D-alanyl-D-alanine carboxypeptidase/D-alanyl-D-alanine-endopeptidase (penicillin-binding protein 4)